VFVERLSTGSDTAPVGLDIYDACVNILNGRSIPTTLDRNGFTLLQHSYDHIDYYDEMEILQKYYPECCKLVKEATGASEVYAFDHNIRVSTKKSWLNDSNKSPEKEVHLSSQLFHAEIHPCSTFLG
jgi:hypothetical protein